MRRALRLFAVLVMAMFVMVVHGLPADSVRKTRQLFGGGYNGGYGGGYGGNYGGGYDGYDNGGFGGGGFGGGGFGGGGFGGGGFGSSGGGYEEEYESHF